MTVMSLLLRHQALGHALADAAGAEDDDVHGVIRRSARPIRIFCTSDVPS